MVTLDLCLKTGNESDHPELIKPPKTGGKWPILILVTFLWFLDCVSAQDGQIQLLPPPKKKIIVSGHFKIVLTIFLS